MEGGPSRWRVANEEVGPDIGLLVDGTLDRSNCYHTVPFENRPVNYSTPYVNLTINRMDVQLVQILIPEHIG